LENRKGTIAAIITAVAAYVEEERKALRPAIPQRRLVAVSTLWSILGVNR